jgi:tetratricopeptide (TPR) repeat protein
LPKHLETAKSLNNLAELYQVMGDYAKAEPLFQQALEIYKKVLGPDDPDTATIVNNLAGLYQNIGNEARGLGSAGGNGSM